jgi:AraC-like DNA-binding protein
MLVIKHPFFARVSPFPRSGAAQLANCGAHRLSKKKLRDDRLSLTDVAAECGFCDQSHFTRMFNRIVVVSPGAWRRALKK